MHCATLLDSAAQVPYSAAAMPEPRRSDEDARLQRLANLSIEIRMLKARAQAALDEHEHSAAGQHSAAGPSVRDAAIPAKRTAPGDPSCPHCGHTAGLSLLPREYRRLSTLVRCFACQRDSAAFDWVDPSSAAHNRTPDARLGRPHP